MKIRRVNSIEQRAGLSCATCILKDECRMAKIVDNLGLAICAYYCNPDKGYYDDSGRRKIK